jgi:hypothetical protein
MSKIHFTVYFLVDEYILDSVKSTRFRRSIVRKGIGMFEKEGSIEKFIQHKK